jgi:hypothetical protein
MAGGGTANKFYCFDVATNNFCANYPITQGDVQTGGGYTLVLDPANRNCVWVQDHWNQITVFDAITGQKGCTSPPSTVTFSGATTVPRLSCIDENGVRAWRNVTLKTPSVSGYSAVKLTVVDSSGQDVTGYTNITKVQPWLRLRIGRI